MAFKQVTATFYLSLPPTCLPNPTAAITRELGALVLTYHEALGGVVLALNKPRVVSTPERVLYDSPFIHLHVTADVLLFAPEVGMGLAGCVNFVGSSHIGLLVHGVVNVSIPADKLPVNLDYDEDDEGEPMWCEDETKQEGRIMVGTEMEFFVTKLNIKAGDISIVGSLLPEDELQLPDSAAQTKAKKDKKEKKRKRDDKSVDEDEAVGSDKKKKKKKKKSKA